MSTDKVLLLPMLPRFQILMNFGKEIINAIENECNVALTPDGKEQFDKKTEDVIRKDGISQDDIDKLFK